MLLRRLAFYCAVALAPFALITSGCSSSHAGLPGVPSTQSSTHAKHVARPKDILAWPIDISAIPIDLTAFGVDVLAWGVTACSNGSSTSASCHAQYRADVSPSTFGPVGGLQPADLQSAYGVTGSASSMGGNQTVAVIIAYARNATMLSNDINQYRSQFGLGSCTPSNGCLQVVNMGQPCSLWSLSCLQAEQNWGIEARLDSEIVSAICPSCHIMIVAAADNGLTNLGNAVQYAASHGATVISNSFSVPETSSMSAYTSYWNTPGVPNVVGAGDNGYGPGFPATSPNVIAVGGTSLIKLGGTWQSKVWAGTGSGCSAFVAKPSWQTDSGCANRTVNDVSAVADPATGVAGYVSFLGGWNVFGGTSVSAPIIAGMYALAGNGSQVNNASSLYANASSFGQVVAMPNGNCTVLYLCDDPGVMPGYTGPSGVGTPVGLTGF